MEREEANDSILFLDMKLTREDNVGTTQWYSKPTDTGLLMSFRALAPNKYKQNIVQGAIHRINHATSSWKLFHTGIEKLTSVLEANQYPPSFYVPLVRTTIEDIRSPRAQGSGFCSNHGDPRSIRENFTFPRGCSILPCYCYPVRLD